MLMAVNLVPQLQGLHCSCDKRAVLFFSLRRWLTACAHCFMLLRADSLLFMSVFEPGL